MATLSLLLYGLVIGIVVAAPVGPIGLLCIQHVISHRLKVAIATGFGAALADGIFAAIAALGLGGMVDIIIEHQYWLRLIGGIVLIFVAGILFFDPEETREVDAQDDYVFSAFGVGLAITLTNPMTILGFVAIFAGLGLAQDVATVDTVMVLTIGVIFGSALWWLILCSGFMLVRHKVHASLHQIINRTAAGIIAVCGFYALYSGAGHCVVLF